MREEISAVIRRTAAWSQRHQGSTMSKKYGCNGIERGKKRWTSDEQDPWIVWQIVWFPDWSLLQVSQRTMPLPSMEVELCNLEVHGQSTCLLLRKSSIEVDFRPIWQSAAECCCVPPLWSSEKESLALSSTRTALHIWGLVTEAIQDQYNIFGT